MGGRETDDDGTCERHTDTAQEPEGKRGKEKLLTAMGSLRRCFIASPTQAASFALAESQHAWEYLSEDAEWLQEVAVQIIDSFFKGSAPSDPVADATHAYMTGFLRPAGLDTLRQAAGAILRMDALACHQK